MEPAGKLVNAGSAISADADKDIVSTPVTAVNKASSKMFEINFIFPLHITHLATCIRNVSDIEAYRSLVECHLVLHAIPGHDISTPHPIYLPNVRHLLVSSSDLLSCLCLPSLKDLTISNGPSSQYDMNVVVLTMNEFVYRCRCSITHLGIHNLVSHSGVFIKECLVLMDSLVSLEIELWDAEVEVPFGALASIGFLPNLQHLSLRIPWTGPSLLDPPTAMINSRSQYLHSIRISCVRVDDAERVNERLAPLWPPGLPMVVLAERGSKYDVIGCFGKFEST
ncbi:hypothetical protein ARMGADRAFT_1167019 [Armillaria gallica]|uniref:F-box domain-containing protein n=1 Tax=Armillaria gallica TaxID=47427 RepID=A0A2H3D4F3_ARMGA|nr:hypothetical protein ARMGADRAFT_1167019 [Armillaria gallica]